MLEVRKREGALRDLIAIWVWYADHAGTEIADRFYDAVESTLMSIAKTPEMGMRVPSGKKAEPGLRKIPVGGGFGKYLLLYVRVDGGVDLVRVVHGNRDLTALGLLKP